MSTPGRRKRVSRDDGNNVYVGRENVGSNPGAYFEDLRFPATAINPPGAVSDPDRDTTFGWLLFAAGGVEIVTGQAQLPHAWIEQTDLAPHVHWMKSSSEVGDVVWRFEYRWLSIGGVMDGSWTTIEESTPVVGTPDSDTENEHLITSFGDVVTTGKTISDMLIWRLSRVGNDAADTYGDDAILIEFDIHYQTDGRGSETQFSKQP